MSFDGSKISARDNLAMILSVVKAEESGINQNRKSETDLQLPTRKNAVSLCSFVVSHIDG